MDNDRRDLEGAPHLLAPPAGSLLERRFDGLLGTGGELDTANDGDPGQHGMGRFRHRILFSVLV